MFRLKKSLESGLEKGWWSLVSGTVASGTFELHVDEFDPTDGECAVGLFDLPLVLLPPSPLFATSWLSSLFLLSLSLSLSLTLALSLSLCLSPSPLLTVLL